MNGTHDTGGVKRPVESSDRHPGHGSGTQRFRDGPMPLFLACGALIIGVASVEMMGEPSETGSNVRYVRWVAEWCTPIRPRIDGLLSDGRVTDDERSIVPTLIDQARAAPGGLERCRQP